MTLGAGKTARRGPTTVTVHDARNMMRDLIEVKVGKTDAAGASAKYSTSLFSSYCTLDLHDLGFFFLQKLLDLGNILIGMLLDLSLLATDIVLGELFVALELVVKVTTDVANGDLGLLGILAALLDELATTLLSGSRERQPHDGTVRVGSNARSEALIAFTMALTSALSQGSMSSM